MSDGGRVEVDERDDPVLRWGAFTMGERALISVSLAIYAAVEADNAAKDPEALEVVLNAAEMISQIDKAQGDRGVDPVLIDALKGIHTRGGKR